MSGLAARFRTSAAILSFSSRIVPIVCPHALQRITASSAGPCARSKLFLPHSAQASSMRMRLSVLRFERRNKSPLLPEFAFDRQLQFLGLVDCFAVAVCNNVVGL
jgi:hypothetical protein